MQTVANIIFTRYLTLYYSSIFIISREFLRYTKKAHVYETYTFANIIIWKSRLTGIESVLTSLAQLSSMSITVLYPGVTIMLTGFLDHINMSIPENYKLKSNQ